MKLILLNLVGRKQSIYKTTPAHDILIISELSFPSKRGLHLFLSVNHPLDAKHLVDVSAVDKVIMTSER